MLTLRPDTRPAESESPRWGSEICCNSFAAAAAAGKSLQSCPTLCDSIDGSPPGSPVPGILLASTLEWALQAQQKRVQAAIGAYRTDTAGDGVAL